MLGGVQAEVADLDPLRAARAGAGRGPPQHRAHPRRHLASREGLDDVVVGPQLEARDPIRLGAACREHDDRHVRLPAQFATHVQAGAVRKSDVQQHQVGNGRLRLLHRLGRGTGQGRGEALTLEGFGEGLRDRPLVFDEQDVRSLGRDGHRALMLRPRAEGGPGHRGDASPMARSPSLFRGSAGVVARRRWASPRDPRVRQRGSVACSASSQGPSRLFGRSHRRACPVGAVAAYAAPATSMVAATASSVFISVLIDSLLGRGRRGRSLDGALKTMPRDGESAGKERVKPW